MLTITQKPAKSGKLHRKRGSLAEVCDDWRERLFERLDIEREARLAMLDAQLEEREGLLEKLETRLD